MKLENDVKLQSECGMMDERAIMSKIYITSRTSCHQCGEKRQKEDVMTRRFGKNFPFNWSLLQKFQGETFWISFQSV